MSIWCNWEDIGYSIIGDTDWENVGRGEVRSYAGLWSNHYPTMNVERPASVNISHIPPWCVPGHHDHYHDGDYADGAPIGGWLRLDMVTWGGKWDEPTGPDGHFVVMDEPAARALAADLLAWADREKLHPKEEPEEDAR